MSTLTRQILRGLEFQGKRKKAPSVAAAHNKHLMELARDTSVMTHFRQLHPTKGYRRVSKLSFMVSNMSEMQRWNTIVAPMIDRAVAHKQTLAA